MKAIYLDCFAGISGNMLLGAFLEVGVPVDYLKGELSKLDLADAYRFIPTAVRKGGIAATHVEVAAQEVHHHRTMRDIRSMISQSALSLSVKALAVGIFEQLAAAEGKVHGVPAEEVHFHEVGAIDSIVDVVGIAVCIDCLDVEKVFVSHINTGSGTVETMHGLMMVPSPATAELLQGFSTYQAHAQRELTTPTGAAVVAALAEPSDGLPQGFVSERIGYGAGSWNLEIPNVLRLYYGTYKGQGRAALCKIETNVDDMTGEVAAYVAERLFAAGALDVWSTPVYMKKNRPAYMLSALVREEEKAACLSVLFAETTSIGMRIFRVDERVEADRHMARVETAYGEIKLKVSAYDGQIVSISPEYDDCRRAALEHGVPLKRVQQAAVERFKERLGD